MYLLLTAIMAVATIVGVSVDIIIVRWHYQDRKRMEFDESRLDYQKGLIEEDEARLLLDEAEIERMHNDRSTHDRYGEWIPPEHRTAD